ncbi:MAG TPA: hypothetical protein VME70_05620 [Mycobacteriales bacterium]|nr:hypothetical protein [Mycobacteriales bacterium]
MASPRARTPLARTITVLALAAAGAAGLAAPAGASRSAGKLPAPPTSPKESAAIEGYAPYQAQFFCRHKVEPGVKAFEKLVLANYPGTHSDGDLRACDDGGTSEHKDGRAWDWGADHRNAKQRADGKSLLHWLFATDSYGNKDAMFRRLGLMYVIWDKRIWGTWSQKWEPYSCSGVTACHVNHIHFSFGWAGAEQKTSFWTGKVSGVVEPPLPRFTSMTAHKTLRIKAKTGSVDAMWLLKGHDGYRAVASGVWHRSGTPSDAMCTKTSDGWRPSRSGVSVTGDQLQGWGEQWVPVHDNGHGCSTDHTYRLVLNPGHSSTVVGELAGAGASKDTGSVRLRFSRTS